MSIDRGPKPAWRRDGTVKPAKVVDEVLRARGECARLNEKPTAGARGIAGSAGLG